VTATMLMTFCVTIDISDVACAGRRLVFAIVRLAREVFFADILFPRCRQAFAA
jgi:hypothetical protein